MLDTTVVIESANCESSGRFVVRNCWLALRNCHRNLPIQIVIQDHSSSPLEQSWKYLAKQLNSMNCRTIPFVQFCLRQKCFTLIGKNWGKTLIFSYFDLVPCVLGWFCQKYLLSTRGLVRALVAVLQASLHPRSLKLLRTSMKLRVEVHAEYNFKIFEQRSQAFSTWT